MHGRLLKIIVLLLLLAVIVYPFIQGYLDWSSASQEALDDLPTLFQKAVLHYNVSTRGLVEPVLDVRVEGQIEDALNLSMRLASMQDWYLSGNDSSVLSLTMRASKSYSYMANASASFYRAVELSSQLHDNITGMLRLLSTCRVDEALIEWGSIKGGVYNLISYVGDGLNKSANVDPDDLLSDSHRDVYIAGVERASKLYSNLYTLASLMNVVESYKEYFTLVCNSSNNTQGIPAPTGLQNSVNSLYYNIMNSNGGPYSYELYSVIAAINSMIAGQQGGDEGSGKGVSRASDSPSGSPGRGAGYGVPPSDD